MLPLRVTFTNALRRIYAHPNVKADRARVCVQNGPYVLCAEGADNGGKVEITLAEQPDLQIQGDTIAGKDENGNRIQLIPYWQWCNREYPNNEDAKMAVWFWQKGMPDEQILLQAIGNNLYGDYDMLH